MSQRSQHRWWKRPPDASLSARVSELRFRELFQNVPDGVYETAEDGRILAANPALIRMLGYRSAEELIQRTTSVQFYADPGQRSRSSAILASDGALHNFEIELVRRDGRHITVLENARVVRDDQNRILFYQGTLTDITERKAAEAALRAARDQALEASRLKSQFLANMSHELRTPLNAVIGMSNLLADSPLPDQQREFAEIIQHSSQFLLELIDQLLDFSAIEAGRLAMNRSTFRLREVVEEAIVMLAGRAAEKHLELVCSLHPDVPEVVCADAARLRQILTNLVGNAVKFTDYGEVQLLVEPSALGPGRTRFTVRDTGIGIPPEARAFIFDPFRQADGSTARRFGGAGLGLAITRQIVERMGGSIDFDSVANRGSTFRFEIDLEPVAACRGRGDQRSPVLAGKSAIVLERNTALRTVLVEWLRRWGVNVLETPDAPHVDFVIASEEVALDSTAMETMTLLRASPGGPRWFLLVPPGGTAQWSGSPWVAGCITRPVRELALLEILLRAFGPQRPPVCAPPPNRATELQTAARQARVLIAEDNRINQKVILRLIERLGHRPVTVCNGFEVLDALQRDRFDLILMDCQMPGLDGLETTAIIRRTPGPLQRTPIIAVTANALEGDREMCLAAGMDDYLKKPIDFNDLSQTIDRWLDRSSSARFPLVD